MPRWVKKGSKDIKMVVVPHRPWYKPAVVLAVTVPIVAAAVVAWLAGFRYGAEYLGEVQEARRQMERRLQEQTRELESLQVQVSLLERSRAVDQQATDHAQQTIAGLQDEIVALERDIALYQQVMALGDEAEQLAVQSWSLLETDLPRYYRYSLVMRQAGTNLSALDGNLDIRLIGTREGEPVELSLAELSSPAQYPVPVNFTYLYRTEGDLVVPEGVEPGQLRIMLQINRPESAVQQFSQDMAWEPTEWETREGI